MLNIYKKFGNLEIFRYFCGNNQSKLNNDNSNIDINNTYKYNNK